MEEKSECGATVFNNKSLSKFMRKEELEARREKRRIEHRERRRYHTEQTCQRLSKEALEKANQPQIYTKPTGQIVEEHRMPSGINYVQDDFDNSNPHVPVPIKAAFRASPIGQHMIREGKSYKERSKVLRFLYICNRIYNRANSDYVRRQRDLKKICPNLQVKGLEYQPITFAKFLAEVNDETINIPQYKWWEDSKKIRYDVVFDSFYVSLDDNFATPPSELYKQKIQSVRLCILCRLYNNRVQPCRLE